MHIRREVSPLKTGGSMTKVLPVDERKFSTETTAFSGESSRRLGGAVAA